MEDGVASSTGDTLGVKNDLTVIVGWAVALAIEDSTASVDCRRRLRCSLKRLVRISARGKFIFGKEPFDNAEPETDLDTMFIAPALGVDHLITVYDDNPFLFSLGTVC